MKRTHLTSNYKIVFILSIFVSIVTIYVYFNLNDSKNHGYKIAKIIADKTNKTILETLLNYDILFNSSFFFDEFNENEIDNTTIQNERLPRIFCMILTTPKNFDIKAKMINQTWAKDCDKYFFITKLDNDLPTNIGYEYSEPFPILQPKDHDVEVYGELTDKIYKTVKDVYSRYSDYDWFLKADDDTFIFVDNLRSFLKTKNASLPVTYGYDFKVIVPHGYHSGGGGYVLSNEAMKRLANKLSDNYNSCPNTGTEDVDVAKCLRILNVFPDKSIDEKGRERFHPLDVGTHLLGGLPDWMYGYASNPVKTGPDCCSENSISFHYMSPNSIGKLYTLLDSFRKRNEPYNMTSILYQMLI